MNRVEEEKTAFMTGSAEIAGDVEQTERKVKTEAGSAVEAERVAGQVFADTGAAEDEEQAEEQALVESEFMEAEPAGAESAGDTCCCCGRKKQRSEKEYKDLINRLSRIEGQIRGIKGMVERDAYCIDILNQASAASSALSSFCKVLLSSHIRTCVTEDVREGRGEKVDELVKTLQKMMR